MAPTRWSSISIATRTDGGHDATSTPNADAVDDGDAGNGKAVDAVAPDPGEFDEEVGQDVGRKAAQAPLGLPA